ncbi:hypothetical protein Malapachy_0391 [Malassezia pachydermatis]|uniref:Uncharacterized protein n=1 Tax=Malassezia pachydermatis TaxID=77020 RepID=A0A0M9VMV1_9BASI|nr:hypothetical protein Malapachy_0391 [Malassezia pachydermatis]KOS12669.1 hypothetical protein Malapachy_0391 [Malassezia pachydermatis]
MSYTIAGMKVLNEHLVLGVFGTIGLAAYAATRGGSKQSAPKAATEVPLNASSPDEEAFIKQFLAEVQQESKE